MGNISFNDGYEVFTINEDPNRVIRINPRDVNILNRFETAMNELKEESESLSEIRVSADGTPVSDGNISLDECTKKLNAFNQTINNKLNYIFNSDVSFAAFGNQSPFSLIGAEGKFLFEVFLEAALIAVKEKIEAATAEVEARAEKYTGKYAQAAASGDKYPFPVGSPKN